MFIIHLNAEKEKKKIFTSRISLVNETMRLVLVNPILYAGIGYDFFDHFCFEVERVADEPAKRVQAMKIERIQLEVIEQTHNLALLTFEFNFNFKSHVLVSLNTK